MEQQTILAALIGILVLVSVFQAFQLVELSGRVQGMTAYGAQSYSAPSGQQTQAGGVQLPAGISSAPNMVGGC